MDTSLVDAKRNLKARYERFMNEEDSVKKDEIGKDLVRTIFGADPIAEDRAR
jgi:hypothetical protein